jgi:hypothetical protein
MHFAIIQAFYECFNSGGLIACGLKFTMEFKLFLHLISQSLQTRRLDKQRASGKIGGCALLIHPT